MYDLTSVLTTIAACSASLVAILGGFIASKLIAINTDRDEVNTRLSELDEEIAFFTEEVEMLQAQLDEDDALDFVGENIESVINKSSLDDTYKQEERPRLEKGVLLPYWTRAQQAFQFLDDVLQNQEDDNCAINEDGVPVKVAQEFTDHFEYTVCKKVCEFYEEQAAPLSALKHRLDSTLIPSTWYDETQEKVTSIESKISYLMLQKKQQSTRHKALIKPKGMKFGLTLFAAFSAANIVYPLCLSPFSTNCYQYYLQTKVVTISAFGIGLALILLYLVYLLRWRTKL